MSDWQLLSSNYDPSTTYKETINYHRTLCRKIKQAITFIPAEFIIF